MNTSFNEWPNLTATILSLGAATALAWWRAAHARRSAGGQLNFSVENYIEVKRVPAEQPKATIISFHNRKQKNRDFQCEISTMKNLIGQKPIG